MYPKAWDIYTFCAQTSVLAFGQSQIRLVSLYYNKNEFENYENDFNLSVKMVDLYRTKIKYESLKANIVLLIMLYTRNVQDFQKKYAVDLRYTFLFHDAS